MKKIFALFTLAAVCCLTGCSNITYIFENDERLYNQTETGFEERFTTLDARAAVYDGEYESFDIPEDMEIRQIIAPLGGNSFIVTKDVYYNIGSNDIIGFGHLGSYTEHGIYTLGGEYRVLFPQYSVSTEDTPLTYRIILYCNDEYILYYTAEGTPYNTDMSQLIELHLLKLGDMTDKRIRTIERKELTENAVICGNAVYFELNVSTDSRIGQYEGEYSESAIIKYDIETGELEKFCLNAGAPAIYKDKPAFYVGDGNFVSYAEPVFDPKEYGLTAKSLKIFPSDEMAYSYYSSTDDKNYTIMGYIKDGKPFNILKANDSISVYDIVFEDGCAVWDCNFFDWKSKMYPMFYSDKKKSVIVIEDKRADYESFICNGKIYFFEHGEHYDRYDRALVLDIENIK